MHIVRSIFAAGTFVVLNSIGALGEQFPEKLQKDIDCLKRHGLVQGTVTDVMRGEAHFAPYFRETNIGARLPSIKFNKDFVEGRLQVSPDIIKTCNPNTTLRKMDRP
jgi:hypothetical protein